MCLDHTNVGFCESIDLLDKSLLIGVHLCVIGLRFRSWKVKHINVDFIVMCEMFTVVSMSLYVVMGNCPQ